MEELKKILKNMFGNNAFDNSFQVNEDFGKLVKAVNYLSSQLMLIKKDLTNISELGRRRFLSAGCVGTPNEYMWIYEVDRDDDKKITDLVCLHNWDYDGFLTIDKVKSIIEAIADKKNQVKINVPTLCHQI